MINKNLLIRIFAHISLLIVGYLFLLQMHVFKITPNNANLLNWDGEFFHSIVSEGYEYIPYAGSNMAFFPLFPLLWKISSISAVGISIINLGAFMLALLWMLKTERVENMLPMFFISLAPMMFFALPYSESTFFLSSVAIILGYKNRNESLKSTGFFFASVTKSSAIIFIPAIVLCELIIGYGKDSNERMINRIRSGLIASIAGTLVAAIIQGFYTGKWFYFLEMQSYWGRSWILPKVPFHTPVAYDAIAWTIGVVAIYICLKYCWKTIFSGVLNKGNIFLNQGVLFSILFLAATTILDTCYTYNLGGANIWSLNRHLFCTPFALLFIIWLLRDFQLAGSDLIVLFIIVTAGFCFTASYNNIQTSVCYILFFVALTIFKFDAKQLYKPLLILIYLFNCFIQLQYYHEFLSGKWIG